MNPLHIPAPHQKYTQLECASPRIDQLYVRGNHPELLNDEYAPLRVGIVGTRDATAAGIADARRLARVVCDHGGIVVSGLAHGIDTSAHHGALDSSGATIAVLGSGVDVIYPTRNEKLAHSIEENGCIISEYDCGTSPLAWHFPIRNRIIAALSSLVVIPEGTLRGGARITADLALAYGKTVCVVPGSRRNRVSELCNALVKDGAVCITDPADILREMNIETDDVGWDSPLEKIDDLAPPAHKVLSYLASEPSSATEIAHLCSWSVQEATRLLGILEKRGCIVFRRGIYEIA